MPPATTEIYTLSLHDALPIFQIESLPYEQILEKYDRPTSFYYIDPPYFQRKLYKFNFSEADFQRLQEQLARRSEEHTSELQSRGHLVCRLLLEKKNTDLDRMF